MKLSLRSLLFTLLPLWDAARATDRLGAADPHLMTAQSHAQTRHNARPPLRTLNPTNHRSDYTYRGGYHYIYQPPRIPPPVAYRPLSPPVTYRRPAVPVPPYHHRFRGPVAPRMHHTYTGLSPPLVHPRHGLKGLLPYKWKGPCPTKTHPAAPPVLVPPPAIFPTPPEPTVAPTLPAATVAAMLTTVATTVPPAPGTLPVSTQSGFITTISPGETGLDPCSMGHDCEHICVNSNASFYCKCRSGYFLNADKRTCSPKPGEEVRVEVLEVLEDPCKCEAQLAFQRKTLAAIQQLTAKLADVSERVERLESLSDRV
ncbi:matrilin-3a isoform X4 [Kryptolebias marmoratus]|uniref:matrilin-3a isoform X4 n=1 Tax=Kryptolebias marmoratus TaxID=37003 RepID=UPI0007F93158|nr:matrilin-3a isoform X4 [Kryptolebias marmoratus]